MKCQLNAENHTEENIFSFKTLNIDIGKNNIEFADLHKVNLEKINDNDNDKPNQIYIKNNKKSKTAIIIISVFAGVIALGVIITLVYILFMRKKDVNPRIKNEINQSSATDINDISNNSKTSDNINN